MRSIGAAVAHFLDMEGVTGSIPVSTTTRTRLLGGFFVISGAELVRFLPGKLERAPDYRLISLRGAAREP